MENQETKHGLEPYLQRTVEFALLSDSKRFNRICKFFEAVRIAREESGIPDVFVSIGTWSPVNLIGLRFSAMRIGDPKLDNQMRNAPIIETLRKI